MAMRSAPTRARMALATVVLPDPVPPAMPMMIGAGGGGMWRLYAPGHRSFVAEFLAVARPRRVVLDEVEPRLQEERLRARPDVFCGEPDPAARVRLD